MTPGPDFVSLASGQRKPVDVSQGVRAIYRKIAQSMGKQERRTGRPQTGMPVLHLYRTVKFNEYVAILRLSWSSTISFSTCGPSPMRCGIVNS
jgi:hypothetical protein